MLLCVADPLTLSDVRFDAITQAVQLRPRLRRLNTCPLHVAHQADDNCLDMLARICLGTV